MVRTGLEIAILVGICARIASRSGLAVKQFINVGPGVVHSNYHGELGIVLLSYVKDDFRVCQGNEIAQLILEKLSAHVVMESKNLTEPPEEHLVLEVQGCIRIHRWKRCGYSRNNFNNK